MRLKFIGTRQFDFSVSGPVTGAVYYVSPASAMGIIDVDERDATEMLATAPHLWEQVGIATPISAEEAAALPPAELEPVPAPRKAKKE